MPPLPPPPIPITTLPSSTYVADGDSTPWPTAGLTTVTVSVSLTSLRGVAPVAWFGIENQWGDIVWGNLWSGVPLSAPASFSQMVTVPQRQNLLNPQQMRLRWQITGDPYLTAVTTGASSSTQQVGSSAGMQAGDTVYFSSAVASRTISSIPNSTHIVLSSSISTTTGETVSATNTPDFTFSASVSGT